MGNTIFVNEYQIDSACSLSSCGIAYLMKYMEASIQVGIEMGLTSQQSKLLIAQCMKGASSLILNNIVYLLIPL